MHIAQIEIENFRNFLKETIKFNPGLNAIIGENNAGKSNLLRALQLVFSGNISRKLSIHDFFKGITNFDVPPKILIRATLQGDENDTLDDKASIAPWLTRLEKPWEATLLYTFSLPDKYQTEYVAEIQKLNSKKTATSGYWICLESFLPKYVARVYGGNPASMNRADPELLEKFDCQLLEAIRDVETRMFSGKNPLLREILEYFLDHDIKVNDGVDQQTKLEKIAERKENFLCLSKPVMDEMLNRISLSDIKDFAEKTGASSGGNPILCGQIKEKEVIGDVQLSV